MKLRLSQITRDKDLSPREETSKEVAEKYSECFEQLPPIVVYRVPDKKNYLLVDGWHRYRAAEILKLESVEVDAKYGSLEEAKEYALLANLKHGLPLTRKEKRYVITEFLKLHPERTNKWIADDLGTKSDTVSTVREELESISKLECVEFFIARDGRRFERKPKEQPKEEKPEQLELDTETETEEEKEEIVEAPIIPMIGIYELNKTHQVDCIEGLNGLPEESVDLLFADPPYNLGKKYGEGFKDNLEAGQYLAWCMGWFMASWRVLKNGGAFYIMHYPEVAAQWKQQLDNLLTFKFRRWITWVYPSNIGHSEGNWRRSHRVILYYIKGNQATYFDGEADPQPYKNPNDPRVKLLGKEGTIPYDWWEYNLVKNVSKDKTNWPNQLPLDLMGRIILSSCPEAGIVCDPFIGSGTTAEAAAFTNRDWIGFDIQLKACKLTMGRVEKL